MARISESVITSSDETLPSSQFDTHSGDTTIMSLFSAMPAAQVDALPNGNALGVEGMFKQILDAVQKSVST